MSDKEAKGAKKKQADVSLLDEIPSLSLRDRIGATFVALIGSAISPGIISILGIRDVLPEGTPENTGDSKTSLQHETDQSINRGNKLFVNDDRDRILANIAAHTQDMSISSFAATTTEAPTPTYKAALGTLREFVRDNILDADEMKDLKEITPGEKAKGGSEYAKIAAYHKEQAEKAQERGDDAAADRHNGIAGLAEFIDRKISSGQLADGELTKLTHKLVDKSDEKPANQMDVDKLLQDAIRRHFQPKMQGGYLQLESQSSVNQKHSNGPERSSGKNAESLVPGEQSPLSTPLSAAVLKGDINRA